MVNNNLTKKNLVYCCSKLHADFRLHMQLCLNQ